MTEQDVRRKIQNYGLRLSSKNDAGDYRVFFPDTNKVRQENRTYYTDDFDDALATANAMARALGEGHECVECKEWHNAKWTEPTTTRLREQSLCFDCDFWLNVIARYAEPLNKRRTAIVKGWCYSVHDMVDLSNNGQNRSHLGHGGRLFHFRWLDSGFEKKSNNVWCNGQVPERFKERMPDTAEFVE